MYDIEKSMTINKMSAVTALEWLKEIELYFQNKAIMSKEDIEIQANTINAYNAKRIIDFIQGLDI